MAAWLLTSLPGKHRVLLVYHEAQVSVSLSQGLLHSRRSNHPSIKYDFLRERCLQWAKSHSHPDFKSQSVWQVFEAEQSHLIPLSPHFDGYAERPARVSPGSLVSFDRNRCSVDCHHVGRTVQLRAYAERIVIVLEGQLVGAHRRYFGSGKTIFDHWHYLPALDRKPGALCNGAPFRHWDLPEAIARVGEQIQRLYPDWDRQNEKHGLLKRLLR